MSPEQTRNGIYLTQEGICHPAHTVTPRLGRRDAGRGIRIVGATKIRASTPRSSSCTLGEKSWQEEEGAEYDDCTRHPSIVAIWGLEHTTTMAPWRAAYKEASTPHFLNLQASRPLLRSALQSRPTALPLPSTLDTATATTRTANSSPTHQTPGVTHLKPIDPPGLSTLLRPTHTGRHQLIPHSRSQASRTLRAQAPAHNLKMSFSEMFDRYFECCNGDRKGRNEGSES